MQKYSLKDQYTIRINRLKETLDKDLFTKERIAEIRELERKIEELEKTND